MSVTVVDCGGLTCPASGAVSLTNTTYNSVATYFCNDGYNLVGDTSRTCLASGNWSGRDASCESTIIIYAHQLVDIHVYTVDIYSA